MRTFKSKNMNMLARAFKVWFLTALFGPLITLLLFFLLSTVFNTTGLDVEGSSLIGIIAIFGAIFSLPCILSLYIGFKIASEHGDPQSRKRVLLLSILASNILVALLIDAFFGSGGAILIFAAGHIIASFITGMLVNRDMLRPDYHYSAIPPQQSKEAPQTSITTPQNDK